MTSNNNNNLPAKVQQWLQHVEEQVKSKSSSSSNIVSVSQALDLTTNPSAARASFPHPLLPPLRRMSYDELVNSFIGLPSVGVTALGSFLAGAASCFGLFSIFAKPKSFSSSMLSRPLKVVFSLAFALIVVKWILTRLPKRRQISCAFNVSSHADGPCIVTGPVVTITNSHAGTHADTPSHFVLHNQCSQNSNDNNNKEDTTTSVTAATPPEFHKSCYSGDCIILDVSATLASRGNKEIDEAALVDAVARSKSSSSTSSSSSSEQKFDWANVWRIIICSRRGKSSENNKAKANENDEKNNKSNNDDDAWTNDFAHFTPAGASFLAHQCPRLMMIGTDAPSVDRCDASPLIRNSHGVFWQHRIAIVENIDCSPLYDKLDEGGSTVVKGQVLCVFNEAQKFEDAEGCNVLFYPE
jgi:hypothetical protein